MSLDFSGLGDLARKTPEQVKRGWEPPRPTDFGPGHVTGWDQSLKGTGWVEVESVGFRVEVLSVGNLKVTAVNPLDQSEEVFQQARRVMRWGKTGRATSEFPIQVHESPPAPGKVRGGGTSSLMAGVAVRCAAVAEGLYMEMMGAQPGKKLVCGNGNAEKKVAHAALKDHVFPWLIGSEKVTNEAQRDALLLTLLWLSRRK